MRGRCLALIILLLLGTTTTTLLLFLREAPDIEQTIYKSPERCCDYAANKEMLDWFRGFFGPGTSEYCRHDFPKVWSDFVDCFVDSAIARGPAIPAAAAAQQADAEPTVLPAVARLVAIGDLHGDMHKARRAFRLGGLTDENDHWVGGTTTAVQVGDQLDRGDNELQILYFLERLQREAARAGGRLHVLNGNHETMNAAGRFNYATLPGLVDFYQWQLLQSWGIALKARCGCDFEGQPEPPVAPPPRIALDNTAAAAARRAALSPGGPVTRRFLAPHPVILQVGSTVFVHGGVLPAHAAYGVDRINRETRAWLNGELPRQPGYLSGRNAVVWARDYSTEDEGRCDCGALRQALAMLPGASRMVVGHTIQEAGINAACGDRVFRIDVGLSKGCGNGDPQVLEILDDSEVRRLGEKHDPKRFGKVADTKAERPTFWRWGSGMQQEAA